MNRTIAIALLATAHAAPLFAEGTDMELGGEIAVWPKDPGRFLFVNAQKRVEAAAIEKPIERLRAEFAVNIGTIDDEHRFKEHTTPQACNEHYRHQPFRCRKGQAKG